MTQTEIRDKAATVLRKFGVLEAYLFGSVARGTATPTSDVDILARFTKLGGLFRYMQVKLELEEALGRRVDLVQMEALRARMRPYVTADQIQIV
jgi:uncharacterized protein